jgi:hypothetical protein
MRFLNSEKRKSFKISDKSTNMLPETDVISGNIRFCRFSSALHCKTLLNPNAGSIIRYVYVRKTESAAAS